jgi:hypothetical protein
MFDLQHLAFTGGPVHVHVAHRHKDAYPFCLSFKKLALLKGFDGCYLSVGGGDKLIGTTHARPFGVPKKIDKKKEEGKTDDSQKGKPKPKKKQRKNKGREDKPQALS